MQNAFAIIPSIILESKELEPNAKLLFPLISSLTHKEGYCWATNKYLAEKMGCSDKAIEKWLKSLKDAHFIKIETLKVGMGWDRKIWISLDFQNIFANPTNVGDRTLQKEEIEPYKCRTELEKNSELKKEENRSEVPKPPKSPSPSTPPSAAASGLLNLFLSKIRERKPDFKEPNTKKWLIEFDRLLRIDKRDPTKVERLICWAAEHPWWSSNCLCPETLRKKYDSMELQMKSEQTKDVARINRDFACASKRQYPAQLKGLVLDARFAYNPEMSKDIPLNMDPEVFKRRLFEMFNGKYYE